MDFDREGTIMSRSTTYRHTWRKTRRRNLQARNNTWNKETYCLDPAPRVW